MRIGVLGTGIVGRTIATKLVELGHEVTMGSRNARNEQAAEWVAETGAGAAQGTFADAAASAELVFSCTPGARTLDALRSIPREHLSGKTLSDVSNPIDFSQGMPPGPFTESRDSLGQIQRGFGWPRDRVVDLGDISAPRARRRTSCRGSACATRSERARSTSGSCGRPEP